MDKGAHRGCAVNLAAVNEYHAAEAMLLARCAAEPDTTPRERAEYHAEIVALARDVIANAETLARGDLCGEVWAAMCRAERAAIDGSNA